MSDKDLIIRQPEPEEMKKTNKVIAECPVCKRKVRKGDKDIILTQPIIMSHSGDPVATLPKITCLTCGVDYFAPMELATIKRNLAKGDNQVITLQ